MRKLSRIIAIVVAMIMVIGSCTFSFASESSTEKKPNGLLWEKQIGGSTTLENKPATPPVYYEGYLYTASGSDLYKIDASTGETLENISFDGDVGSRATIPVTVASDKILVPLNGGEIAIVDRNNKTSQTVTYADNQASSQTISPITYDKGFAYVGSWLGRSQDGIRGSFARVDINSGEVTKIIDNPYGFYWSGACATGDYVLFGSNSSGGGTDIPSIGTASLYCWNGQDAAGDSVDIPSIDIEGSVCSTIIEHSGAYYFTSKGGYLYKVTINEGMPVIEAKLSLGGPSTCTPLISGDRIYVGYSSGVVQCDLQLEDKVVHITPADVKHLNEVSGHILCTYNKGPGGIYDITSDWHYFIPDSDKQQYCISDIAVSGSTLYYKNDSGYFFAVDTPSEPVRFNQKIAAKSLTKTYGSSSFNIGAEAEGNLTYKSSATSVATISSTGQVTIKGIGKTTITINAEATDKYNAASATVTVTVTPKTTSGFKAYAGKKKITAKWTKDTKATGYQVIIAKNSEFTSGKKTYTVKGYKSVSKTIKSLTRKKYYYVKMRTYKTVSGTNYYGPYTSVKKIKVK